MAVTSFPRIVSIAERGLFYDYMRQTRHAVEYDVILRGVARDNMMIVSDEIRALVLGGDTYIGQGRERLRFELKGNSLEECIDYEGRERFLSGAISMMKWVSRMGSAPAGLYFDAKGLSTALTIHARMPILRVDPSLLPATERYSCPYQ